MRLRSRLSLSSLAAGLVLAVVGGAVHAEPDRGFSPEAAPPGAPSTADRVAGNPVGAPGASAGSGGRTRRGSQDTWGVEWRYVGPTLRMSSPRVVSVTCVGPGRVALGFAPSTPGGTAITVIWDTTTATVAERIENPVPLQLRDFHGNLSGLSARGDNMRRIVRQRMNDGTYAIRIVVLPRPEAASASEPYLTRPARQSPDGALILLGSGRDRFYRINPALGSVRTILPSDAIEVVDYDMTAEGAILAMDGFERKLLWLDLDGNLLDALPLSSSEQEEPRFYYLSVAAAEGTSAWVGVAVRQDDGSYVPEVQRVRGQLRERQRLVRGDGSYGMPVLATGDGHGGVFLVDEGAWVYHVSSSAVVNHVWRVPPSPPPGAGNPEGAPDTTWYVTESGTLIHGLDTIMTAARRDLESCYAVLRQVKPGAAGTIRVKLTTRDRRVVRTEVYAKDFEALGLESCAAVAFRKLKLPRGYGRQVIRAALTFGPVHRTTGGASSG